MPNNENYNNERAKRSAKFDQLRMEIGDTIIPALYDFYTGCKGQGFSKKQAFELTKIWLEGIIN